MNTFGHIYLGTKSQGVVGMVMSHGFYNHPQIDMNHQENAMIDASYAFFKMENFSFVKKFMFKYSVRDSILMMEDHELDNMKLLFKEFEEASFDSTVHPSVQSFKIFKRCVIYPIYTNKNDNNVTKESNEKLKIWITRI
jgi:hypothetical protein